MLMIRAVLRFLLASVLVPMLTLSDLSVVKGGRRRLVVDLTVTQFAHDRLD